MNLFLYLRTQWDRAGAITAALLGGLVLLLGYLGTRSAVLVEQQMPYIISGGILGVFLLALGGVLWLSADLRDDWREVRELKHQVTRIADQQERVSLEMSHSVDGPDTAPLQVVRRRPARSRAGSAE